MTKSTRSKSKKAYIKLPAITKVLPEIRGIGMIEMAYGSNTFNLGTNENAKLFFRKPLDEGLPSCNHRREKGDKRGQANND